MGAFGSFMVSLFIILLSERSHEEICAAKVGADHELNMNVISKRNDTGEWVSTFTAEKKSKRNSSVIDVDVSFKSFDCNRMQTVHIRGVLKETMKKSEERLLFHPNCGTNIAIVNGGRSIVKFNNVDGNDIAMTKRPLKDDELFEVRLDRKISKNYYSMGIGVTTHDPHNMVLPMHMSHLKTGTWMFFHSNLYNNGSLLRENYAPNIDKLEPGERLGVKRTEFGTLHLLINGVDQGPAASRVPAGVFGVYQLHGNAVEATIVDAS